ncbi:MAG: hypothetical protein H6737_11935 [Alphaproteobacteria bacterium]|nr:hypothetical protein [Alphaproteobacteria bacterium]
MGFGMSVFSMFAFGFLLLPWGAALSRLLDLLGRPGPATTVQLRGSVLHVRDERFRRARRRVSIALDGRGPRLDLANGREHVVVRVEGVVHADAADEGGRQAVPDALAKGVAQVRQ